MLTRAHLVEPDTAFPGHEAGVDLFHSKIAKPALEYTLQQGGRDHELHSVCAEISRQLLPQAYPALAKAIASNDPDDTTYVINRVIVLTKENDFLYPGKLECVAPNNPQDTRMQYKIEKNIAFITAPMIELTANLIFGAHPQGISLLDSNFPNATYLRMNDENEGRKEIGLTAAAFVAMMLEIAIKDYTSGKKAPIMLRDDTLCHAFDTHMEMLKENRNISLMWMQELYDQA
ncbi:unnamed protein product, partial [Peniophora sp. CBMAI 1063]